MRARACVVFFCILGGCSDDEFPPPDFSFSVADASFVPVQLFSPTENIKFDSYYSMFYEPNTDHGPDLELAVTWVDPQFRCTGPVPNGLEVLTALFSARTSGISATKIVIRGGPVLGQTNVYTGWSEIDNVDDRAMQIDGGYTIGEGGSLDGEVDYEFPGDISVRGSFHAIHCPAFDFTSAE